MTKPMKLQCVLCGREYEPGAVRYTCPSCGLDGTLDVLYDYDEIRPRLNRTSLASDPDRSLWRYRAVLPVENDANIPSLSVGWTPLYDAPKLKETSGVRKVFVKDDGRNPTASLKDRASAVGVAKALDAGQKIVSCASTGNAAS